MLGGLCWTVLYLVVYHSLHNWWGTPSSHEMVSETYQDWFKWRTTPVSQQLKLPNAAAHHFPTENELLAYSTTHWLRPTTIEGCLWPKIPILFWVIQRNNGISKDRLSQSHWFNVIDTFRNMGEGTAWESSREFMGQRHPPSGDDIVPIACSLSNKDWCSERCD